MGRRWTRVGFVGVGGLCSVVALLVHGCGGDSAPLTEPPPDNPGTPPGGSPPPSASIRPTKLSLAYVCDTKFRATNRNSSAVTLTFKVDSASESGPLQLGAAPNDSTPYDTVFATKAVGTVRLLWHDSTVAKAANGRKSCQPVPPPPPPPPTPSRSRSSVTAAPSTFELGADSATVKVTVVDSTGKAMAGVPVTLSVSGTGVTIHQPPRPTDSAGVAVGSFGAAAAGAKTVSAKAGGVTLNATATVAVTAPPPPPPEATTGQWTRPFAWPHVAVHLTLLPTGRILSFGHYGDPVVWDPDAGTFRSRPSPSLVFCAGHLLLPDGRVLVAGGHIDDLRGLPNTNIFDPATESWVVEPPMAFGRWYPTLVTLANGDVVSFSGEDQNGNLVAQPEIWSGGGWRTLTGSFPAFPDYPRVFLAPDGRIFYAGERAQSGYYDLSGAGSWTPTTSTQLGRSRGYGSAVMYAPGRILYVGGGLPPTATAEVIDLNDASPRWQFTGSMAHARRHLNATLLPDGTVLATGGVSRGDTTVTGQNDLSSAVLAAELWDPATGRWTTLASSAIPRGYHSTSLLLPDGRVLHTGAGDAGDAVDQKNAEIFSPPYLFKGARPTITSAPTQVGYGETFTVGTAKPADVARVTLVRLSSVTHAFNMNQRFVELAFTAQGDGVAATAPRGPLTAPPGHYMLFILDGKGVPSVARIVRLR
jgi:hypothetical protein